MRYLARFLLPFLLISAVAVGDGGSPDEDYERISQCILVRERASLVGQKVQVKGKYLQGTEFCHVIRKAGIDTRDYHCFALGEPCILRMYLHKEHPQAGLLTSLKNGDEVTVYGVFDYMAANYNYLILDRFAVTPKE